MIWDPPPEKETETLVLYILYGTHFKFSHKYRNSPTETHPSPILRGDTNTEPDTDNWGVFLFFILCLL